MRYETRESLEDVPAPSGPRAPRGAPELYNECSGSEEVLRGPPSPAAESGDCGSGRVQAGSSCSSVTQQEETFTVQARLSNSLCS